MQGGDVEHDAARDDRRMFVGPCLAPGATSKMIVDGEAVEDLAVIAKVVEGIDVRSRMGVHRDGITGIGHEIVCRRTDTHHVVHLFAPRRMGHPDLIRLIFSAEPARHPDEIVDRKVVHVRRVRPVHDRFAGFAGDEIEHSDLIF
jgi:hypothetical protein